MHRVDTLDEVKQVINLHRPSLQEKYHISKIAIFGSVVKDELDEQSDIDILVEFDGPVKFSLWYTCKTNYAHYLEEM